MKSYLLSPTSLEDKEESLEEFSKHVGKVEMVYCFLWGSLLGYMEPLNPKVAYPLRQAHQRAEGAPQRSRSRRPASRCGRA